MTQWAARRAFCIAAAICCVVAASPCTATPVGEARKLVKRMAAIKGPSELPPLLTNETAAGMGVMFGAILGMTGAMAEAMTGMAEGMAEDMGGAKAKPRPDPKQAAKMAQLKAISTDVKGVFRKYGLDASQQAPPSQAQRKRIVASGRALLTDVLRILDRMPDSKGKGGKDLGFNTRQIRPERISYRQLSATRVLITDPDNPKEKIEARLEGAVWRVHIPSAAQILDGKGPALKMSR